MALTLGDQFDGEKTDNDEDIAVASMTLHNNHSAVMLKPEEENLCIIGDEVKDIKMHPTTVTTGEKTTGKPAFEAISSFFINSGTKLLTLTLNNGRQYTYTISNEVEAVFQNIAVR